MREYFGWTKSSDMPKVYVHLSGRDVDSTLLKHYGIKVEVPKEKEFEPKACPGAKPLIH
jgi:integrase/recombinase XerD